MDGPAACTARLIRLLRRKGRSHPDAEDLVQEAFLRLQEYLRTAKVRNEEAFLVQTATHLAVDHYRRQQRRSFVTREMDSCHHDTLLIDLAPSPERILTAEQTLEQVRRILIAVSHKTCEIFFAHRAGYSYDEIATEFDVTPRTVQKHIARAMLILMRSDFKRETP